MADDLIEEKIMADVSFEIKGKMVQPEDMTDVLDILFLKHLRERINTSAASISCKEHCGELSVLVKGQDLNNLTYEMSGCCEDLIKKIRKKIK